MLDRAPKLDPLEPAHDVTKAVFLFYGRGDAPGANALLIGVLKRNPRYAPALAWLCNLRISAMGQIANGIRYCESALELDPLLEHTRRVAIRAYVNLGYRAAAEQLLGGSFDEPSPRALPILLDQRQWVPAGEVAYASIARDTASPVSMTDHLLAIRMHARTTGDLAHARAVLEEKSGVRWDAMDPPVLREKGSPTRMRHERADPDQSEMWYFPWHPVALALVGDHDATLDMIERQIASKYDMALVFKQMEIEPSFADLRNDPRFQALQLKLRSFVDDQRRQLDQLREGLVPDRTSGERMRGAHSADTAPSR